MTAVKICGISDKTSLNASVAAGADYIGLVHFAKSPRHVNLEKAAKLVALLPSHVASVVVVVDANNEMLADIIRIVSPSYIQLHGHETIDRVKEIRKNFSSQRFIKAISVSSGDDIATAHAFAPHVDMLLFDAAPSSCGLRSSTGSHAKSKDPSTTLRYAQDDNDLLPGGNGLSFDWALLAHRQFAKPWILSGGLNADNVAEAIRITGAPTVDVSSGVESAQGVKDAALIRAFIKAAK